MRYYWITLFLIFIACGIASAQNTSPDVTKKRADLALEKEQKKELKKKQRADAAEQKREDRIEKRTQYKKARKTRKTRMRDHGIAPHPAQSPVEQKK
jgi:hypothetical protein